MREPPDDVLYSRILPAGVTGIPRLSEWDAVEIVELPELAGETLAEFELLAAPGAELEVRAAERVPPEAVARVAAELDAQLERPYEALAVRQDGNRFSVGARSLRAGESIELPQDLPAASIEVVRAPDGDVQESADGEPIDPSLAELYRPALELLGRHGGERFESFVARADKGDGERWQVTVDPL